MNATRGLCCALLAIFCTLFGIGMAHDLVPEWLPASLAVLTYFVAGSGN